MAETTARFTWCEHCVNGSTHENTRGNLVHITSIAKVDGIDGQVSVETSYIDGDREPQTYVGGNADLTPRGLDEVIAVLQEHRLIIQSVEPTPALVR